MQRCQFLIDLAFSLSTYTAQEQAFPMVSIYTNGHEFHTSGQLYAAIYNFAIKDKTEWDDISDIHKKRGTRFGLYNSTVIDTGLGERKDERVGVKKMKPNLLVLNPCLK
ncbi:Hypothetical predicted protein [Octopus vulgaris]|uniref:Uncharacterized protein n=1 Tax=Octopus vulgaris TaxID=6645 RepID=A0AA36AVS0_OCTVU|nr:Hypothetical predicted protein [Octopus vulgaris]